MMLILLRTIGRTMIIIYAKAPLLIYEVVV